MRDLTQAVGFLVAPEERLWARRAAYCGEWLITALSGPSPGVGQLVLVRDRRWVVTDARASELAADLHLVVDADRRQMVVQLASVDDDGLDRDLTTAWETELAATWLATAVLPRPQLDRFDEPRQMDAFLDAVRWGAPVAADKPALVAPFRSGITVEDYQLDPVVRATRMPRVRLLLADDFGLGKTVEAGLVVQELLLRRRVRTVLVVCPATLTLRWQAELATKFGLEFRIVDTGMARDLRRTHGPSANPFTHFPRLIVSVDWLNRPRSMRLLQDVLPADAHSNPRRFDLLIVDEVHTMAPAGTGHYSHDSQRTDVIRTVAPHFEHRLFLSATPHNGYEESFTAMLEMLDPQRFARLVPPNPASLARATVRRLKSDLRVRERDGSARFPERALIPLDVVYPDTERHAHSDLARYHQLRTSRAQSAAAAAAADLVTLLLKKRLLSSPAAFARTLDVHLRTMADADPSRAAGYEHRLRDAFDRLDEDVDREVELVEATGDALTAAADHQDGLRPDELAILAGLRAWADDSLTEPDAKTERLVDWLEAICTSTGGGRERVWNNERVLVVTEYRETQSWLAQLLTARGLGAERLVVLYGGMDPEVREHACVEVSHHPAVCPVRIVLATDAAGEVGDVQSHCHRIVHVEIPFSPTRLEQRNSRIDRHGQRAARVLIHHFVGAGPVPASPGSLDANLGFLSLMAHRVEVVHDDLGVFGPVLAGEVHAQMLGRPADVNREPPLGHLRAAHTINHLEPNLADHLARLRARLDNSRIELDLSPEAVERAVSAALELGGQPPLRPCTLTRKQVPGFAARVFEVPPLSGTWALAAADLYDEVTELPRPITFDHRVADADADGDVALAHLGHPLVAQSIRRLRSEMWSSGVDACLSRVCARTADVDEVTVVAHARLVVTSAGGGLVHEEVIQAGGRISHGRFAAGEEGQINAALASSTAHAAGQAAKAELVAVWDDIEQPLCAALEARAEELTDRLRRTLDADRAADAATVTEELTSLRAAIRVRLRQLEPDQPAQDDLALFDHDERKQFDRDVNALRRRVDEISDEIEAERNADRRRDGDLTRRVFPIAVTFLVPASLSPQPGPPPSTRRSASVQPSWAALTDLDPSAAERRR